MYGMGYTRTEDKDDSYTMRYKMSSDHQTSSQHALEETRMRYKIGSTNKLHTVDTTFCEMTSSVSLHENIATTNKNKKNDEKRRNRKHSYYSDNNRAGNVNNTYDEMWTFQPATDVYSSSMTSPKNIKKRRLFRRVSESFVPSCVRVDY